MRLHLPTTIRNLDDLLDFHQLPDEEIIGRLLDPVNSDASSVELLCAESRPPLELSYSQLVATYHPVVVELSTSVGAGGGYLFGECEFVPGRLPVISVNYPLLDEISRLMVDLLPPHDAACFESTMLVRVVVAHELYHIRTALSGGWRSELGAHVFARSLTGWRFSPLIFNFLKRFIPVRTDSKGGSLEALSWN